MSIKILLFSVFTILRFDKVDTRCNPPRVDYRARISIMLRIRVRIMVRIKVSA